MRKELEQQLVAGWPNWFGLAGNTRLSPTARGFDTAMGGTASCGGYVWTGSRWSVCPCFTSHSHQGFRGLQDLVPLLSRAPERLREVQPKVPLSHTWGGARQVTQYACRTEFAVASRPAYRATRLTPGMTSASSTRTEVSRVSPETIVVSER